MPRSRPTSGHSDHTSATDAATFQPRGRGEVGHRGRRIPDRLRILVPSTEPVSSEAAGRNEAREKCGHESSDRARTTYLRSPTRGPRPSRDQRFATLGCRGERELLNGSDPGGPERRRARSGTPLCPQARPCGAHPSRIVGSGFCRLDDGTDGARGRGRGRDSGRRRVGSSRALLALSLGWRRLGHRSGLVRSRSGLFSRGALGGRGPSVGLSLRGSLGRRHPGWQKALGIQVAPFVRSLANPQVHVGLVPLARPARPDRAHLCALGDRSAFDLRNGSEMEERHRQALGRSNSDRAPAAGHRAGEREAAGRRGEHRLPCGSADVDSSVLARGVRVPVVAEVLQHRPARRPGPGVRGRRAGQEREEDRQQQAVLAHAASSVVGFVNRREASVVRPGCQDRRHTEG
jgi:hypothetical protein